MHDPEGTWGSRDSKTALHAALMGIPWACAKHISRAKQIVKMLLEAGADVNSKRSSYDWRGCGGSESAFDMVLEKTGLLGAGMLELCLAHGADPNMEKRSDRHSMRTDGSSSSRPLHGANAAVTAVLLQAGAQVDTPATEVYHNERGYNQDSRKTALHLAVERGDLDKVTLLVAYGADVNAVATWIEHEDTGATNEVDDPRADDYELPGLASVWGGPRRSEPPPGPPPYTALLT